MGIRSDERRIYNPIQKDYATFLETGGERTLIEIQVAPGGGNPPHYHLTYDEYFEVIEGALEVMVGGETRTLRRLMCNELDQQIRQAAQRSAEGVVDPLPTRVRGDLRRQAG